MMFAKLNQRIVWGEFVLSHDRTLRRVFGVPGSIDDYSVEELKDLPKTNLPLWMSYKGYIFLQELLLHKDLDVI